MTPLAVANRFRAALTRLAERAALRSDARVGRQRTNLAVREALDAAGLNYSTKRGGVFELDWLRNSIALDALSNSLRTLKTTAITSRLSALERLFDLSGLPQDFVVRVEPSKEKVGRPFTSRSEARTAIKTYLRDNGLELHNVGNADELIEWFMLRDLDRKNVPKNSIVVPKKIYVKISKKTG